MEFFATCAAGFERLLAQEVHALDARHVRPLRGQVSFTGSLASAYRVCLWSRLASRVIAVLTRIDAPDANELYDGVFSLAWENQIPRGVTLAIDAHGTNDALRNTHFTALRVKDAIADRLAETQGIALNTDPAHPDLTVIVRLRATRTLIGIDLAGEPLFHRDGRHTREKPGTLRPDYAAALLAAGGWRDRLAAGNTTLLCMGSGSEQIVQEATMWAAHRAPNLLRQHWGFEMWAQHDKTAWEELIDEADGLCEQQAVHPHELHWMALDTKPLSELQQDLSQHSSQLSSLLKHEALLCCTLSPLLSENSGSLTELFSRIHLIASRLKRGSCLVTLTADDALDTKLGMKPQRRTQIYLGAHEGVLSAYELTEAIPPPRMLALRSGISVPIELAATEQFARRLEKNWRLKHRWARREDVSCMRVYDADLPDYALAIDRFSPSDLMDEAHYGGTGGGPWAVVAEYAAPKEIDPRRAHTRLVDALQVIGPVLGVAPTDIYLRQRTRAKGGSQYAIAPYGSGDNRKRSSPHGIDSDRKRPHTADHHHPGAPDSHRNALSLPSGAHLVDEGGLTFEVNFEQGLDVGLFLDTRLVRSQLRERAKEMRGSRRFLNLFAYTGSASCYAADGGARHTTTVDLSRPYLTWAQRNMTRNGFDGPEHEYVQADVLSWIREQRHTPHRWDLVYLDPPTFSNSSRMRTSSFDIQRDHVELLIGVSRLLTRTNGICVFCCNLRSFVLDLAALAKAGVTVEDITPQTIPDDFNRTQHIHHCYLVRRTPTPTHSAFV